jgi:hypothetical protein
VFGLRNDRLGFPLLPFPRVGGSSSTDLRDTVNTDIGSSTRHFLTNDLGEGAVVPLDLAWDLLAPNEGRSEEDERVGGPWNVGCIAFFAVGSPEVVGG